MKTTQGIIKINAKGFQRSKNRGLPTLGVGSMQFYFLMVLGASHPKFNAFISMDDQID